jgi:hypothetical protein
MSNFGPYPSGKSIGPYPISNDFYEGLKGDTGEKEYQEQMD